MRRCYSTLCYAREAIVEEHARLYLGDGSHSANIRCRYIEQEAKAVFVRPALATPKRKNTQRFSGWRPLTFETMVFMLWFHAIRFSGAGGRRGKRGASLFRPSLQSLPVLFMYRAGFDNTISPSPNRALRCHVDVRRQEVTRGMSIVSSHQTMSCLPALSHHPPRILPHQGWRRLATML